MKGVYPKNAELEDFLVKRTASHGIELLGLLTLHVSPIWVLAALADATGAGHALIEQIADSLKQEGLLERDAHFETLDQVLNGLEKTSAQLADTLNMPPVTLKGLRREWEKLREALPNVPAANLPTLAALETVWNKLVRVGVGGAPIGVCALFYAGGGNAGGSSGKRVLAVEGGANGSETNRTTIG